MHALQQLLDAAFETAAASDANTAISRVREEHAARLGSPAWSYEVLLPSEKPTEHLVNETLPRLIYFLASRGSAIGVEVFLSLFVADKLYFIAVPDALPILSEWSGIPVEDMRKRWSEGFGAPPLALPGPRT